MTNWTKFENAESFLAQAEAHVLTTDYTPKLKKLMPEITEHWDEMRYIGGILFTSMPLAAAVAQTLPRVVAQALADEEVTHAMAFGQVCFLLGYEAAKREET